MKKFLSLALGVVAFVSVNAQPAAGTPVTINGIPVFVTGTVNGVAVNNQQLGARAALTVNSTFTYNGQLYAILPATQPNAFNPLQNILFDNNVVVDLNGNSINNVNFASLFTLNPMYNGDQVFGTQTGNFTVVPVPFDLGLSAVLGAGAIAAVKARRRRKELEVVA